MSSIGELSCDREPARALSMLASSSFLPTSALDASAAKSGVGADRAECDARSAPDLVAGSRRSRDAHADHRDIHLVARDEAQIGVRTDARFGAAISNSTSNSSGCEHGPAGRGAELLDRDRPLALGADDARPCAERD